MACHSVSLPWLGGGTLFLTLSFHRQHVHSHLLQSHFSRLGDKLSRPDVCKPSGPRNALSSLMDPAPLVRSAGMCWMDWDPSKMLNRPALGCLPLTACESRQPCLKPQRCWHPACNYLSPPPSPAGEEAIKQGSGQVQLL